MYHSTHTRLNDADISREELIGATIYGPDDETVGTIAELVWDGTTKQAIVDVGGFLGIASKPVLVALTQLNLMRHDTGAIHGVVSWTKAELKNFPEYR